MQAVPQAPQLLEVVRSVQTPLQQSCPLAQAVPQAPQLVVVCPPTQAPLQQSWLGLQ